MWRSPRGCFVQAWLSEATSEKKLGEQSPLSFIGSSLIAWKGHKVLYLAGSPEGFAKWWVRYRCSVKARHPSTFVHMQSVFLERGGCLPSCTPFHSNETCATAKSHSGTINAMGGSSHPHQWRRSCSPRWRASLMSAWDDRETETQTALCPPLRSSFFGLLSVPTTWGKLGQSPSTKLNE